MSWANFYRERVIIHYTKENVTQALVPPIIVLNSNRYRFLRAFQWSPHAWPVLNEILADVQCQPMHVLLFAACTILLKIKREAYILTPERVLHLKSCLIQHLQEAALLPFGRPLVIQLALCLVHLGLYYASCCHELPELSEAMVQNCPEHIRAFLVLLELLPWEAREFIFRVRPDREPSIYRHLWEHAPHVVTLMGHLIGNDNIGIEGEKQCLRVIIAWTQHGVMDADDLINSRVFLRVSLILHHEEVHIHAEACSVLVALLKSAWISRQLQLQIFEIGNSLEDKFLRAVARNKKALMANYVAVFLQLASTTLTVAQGTPTFELGAHGKALFRVLLQVTRYCEWSAVELAMKHWQKLMCELNHFRKGSAFEPLLRDLMRILFERIQLRDCHQHSGLHHSTRFAGFRRRVAETVRAMAPLVTPIIMETFWSIAQNPASPWMQVEAAAFILLPFINPYNMLKASLYERLLKILSQRPENIFRGIERRVQKKLRKRTQVTSNEPNCSS
ncbi:transportin-3-like [Drosophila bipectinata]|uniref:transportin-3-like n=1 Tax=Drosophila bipectinata TaxID=42026 RepID=UPI0038B3BBEA